MIDRSASCDAAASLLERRWFASLAAVRTMQAECEVLREVMEMAESSWRHARSGLARLEALRDALGEQLADCDGRCEVSLREAGPRSMSSAA